MNEYRLTHSVFECVTVTEIHWSLWWRWHHLVAVWYLPQLCPGIVHLQVRFDSLCWLTWAEGWC